MTVAIKLTLQIPPTFTPEDMQWARQMGVANVSMHTVGGTLETFRSVQKSATDAQLALVNIGNTDVHNMPSVVLNLPDRDDKIAQYLAYLHNLYTLGISYTTYAHMASGLWCSDPATLRGGAVARTFDIDNSQGYWIKDRFQSCVSFDRVYSVEELWDNLAYFLQRVLPEAEKLGIRVGLHPDDPPGISLGGVPRILSSVSDFQRAFALGNSPNLGICLCAGTWLEGGATMGATVEEAIRIFADSDRLFKVHFRNVTSPVPKFAETFLDDGYGDMTSIMTALRDVGFGGILIADHVPETVGDWRIPWSLSIGYIQGLMDALKVERER